MTILARTGVPLYLQLSEVLEKKLDSGEFPPGSKLPGDAELAATYRVSLITARAAMRVLIEKQRIVRYPGKGTFVLDDDRIRGVWTLGSISDLVLTGLKSKLILLERRLCIPPTWVSKKFSIPSTTRLYAFHTARESQGERFTVTDIYHPRRIGELIKDVDFENMASQSKLMITVVQEKTGIRPHEVHQSMSAELADAKTARELRVDAGQPLLVLARDYYSADGELIQTGRSKYRVDHYQYEINLSRFSRASGRQVVDGQRQSEAATPESTSTPADKKAEASHGA